MIKEILPSSLKIDKKAESITEAADKIIKELLPLIEKVLIVPNIDNVPSDILDLLAWQFHLEGYELAQTDEQKRTMIKKAIELHKYKGTPWAVKEVLKAAGYYDASIEERLPQITYNGDIGYNGSELYNAGSWALFRVILDIGERSLTKEDIKTIKRIIDDYKNARSHLKDIQYKSSIFEDVNLTDTVKNTVDFKADDELKRSPSYDGSIYYNNAEFFFYNGKNRYDADIKYSAFRTTGHTFNAKTDTYNLKSSLNLSSQLYTKDRYDGFYRYSGSISYAGFTQGAVDSNLVVKVSKHLNYNGKYTYGQYLYNGRKHYNREIIYTPGILYKGALTYEEVIN